MSGLPGPRPGGLGGHGPHGPKAPRFRSDRLGPLPVPPSGSCGGFPSPRATSGFGCTWATRTPRTGRSTSLPPRSRSTTEELPGFAAGGRAANAVEQGSRLAYYPLPRHECTLIAREEGRCPMRAGAAIIVLIGVCIAGEVLFLRGTTADGGMMGFLLSSVGSDQELAELQNAVWRTIDFSIITNFTTLILLVALFIRVSRETNPKPRHYERPPKDAFVLLQRTTARRQFPFQFGIITLLAATLAVALICSAFSIPLQ